MIQPITNKEGLMGHLVRISSDYSHSYWQTGELLRLDNGGMWIDAKDGELYLASVTAIQHLFKKCTMMECWELRNPR
jgi:regulation of enolase protein 1 (concanavalin A-like superfamily)